MRLIVDTSILIDYLRQKQSLDTAYARLQSQHEVVLSLVTVAELYSGKGVYKDEKARALVEELLSGVDISIPTLTLAQSAGRLRSLFDLALADAFIAALALELQLPLVTLNTRDFTRISRLQLLPLKNL